MSASVAVPVLLTVLAVFDCALTGFRAAAGRMGLINKASYYRRAIFTGIVGGLVIVGINVAVATALVLTAPHASATWSHLLDAGTICIWFFGALATATLAAMALWFSPTPEIQLLATVIVLGPFTLIRPLVIVAGLVAAALHAADARVWIAAAVAGITMLSFERVLGQRYAGQWRELV